MTPPRRSAIAAPIMLLAALALGCVAHPAPVRVSAGVGYFGPPVAFNYGVWGPRYRVAPFHAPAPRRAFVPGPKVSHAFVAAPVVRPVPSIPPRRRPPVRRF